MVGYRVIGWVWVLLVLGCLSRLGVAADAPKPAADAPTIQVWKLPALGKVGCFTIAAGQYAVIQELPAGNWHLLNLKTGTAGSLPDLLKEISGSFKGSLTSADFCPVGNGLLARTDAGEPWWYDLAARKGVSLVSATGSQVLWVGDKVVQYEPRPIVAPTATAPADPFAGRPVDAKAIDVAHGKVVPCKVSGTVVAVSDKGNIMICRTIMHLGFRIYKPAYGIFSVPAGQGKAIAGDTNPSPRFVLSPGGKYVLATTYDAPGGADIAGLSAKTRVLSLIGAAADIALAQVGSPVFVSDTGRAVTRTDRGVLLIWDRRGKESVELVKDSVQAGVWGGNLYYLTNAGDHWLLNMIPLPADPKAKS